MLADGMLLHSILSKRLTTSFSDITDYAKGANITDARVRKLGSNPQLGPAGSAYLFIPGRNSRFIPQFI